MMILTELLWQHHIKIKARKHLSAPYEFALVSLVYFEMLQATTIKSPNSFDVSWSPPGDETIGRRY